MQNNAKQVAIVGAGVIGLTSGIRLLEDGAAVTIMANELPPTTTSDAAAAYWLPTGNPKKRVEAWGRVSFNVFSELAQLPESGVFFRQLNKLSHSEIADPIYHDILDDFERHSGNAVAGDYSHAIRMSVPVAETPIYMPYLVKRFQSLGGRMEQRTVDNLHDLANDYALIVNCAGAWAAKLANDPDSYPIRGQIVRIRKPEGLSPELFSMSYQGEPIYIVPRENDCVLGGTQKRNDWNRIADMPTADDIMARCAAFNPLLHNPEIIDHRVGLRPGRSEVRLEAERLTAHCNVIHNYGHGEDGHGMAWGCAAEVAGLTAKIYDF